MLQPLGLAALIAIPLVLLWSRIGHNRRTRANARLGDAVAMRPPFSSSRERIRTSLLVGSCLAVGLAVARPAWGIAEEPLRRRGIDVAIALDVSRSMSTGDIPPSRAEAAASGLQRLLRALPGDRASLVTFAGTAFARSPLTLDLDALRQLIEQAQGETALVDRGTDLALAIEAALTTLDVDDRADTQVIVVVSDGEHVGRDLDAAVRHASDLGVRVYSVAAATAEGATIPGNAPVGGPSASKLDRATLQRIADDTGGGLRELSAIAGLAVEFSRLRQSTFAATTQAAPVERFPWFIAGGLVLLLVRSLVNPWRTRPNNLPTHHPGGAYTVIAATLAMLLVACAGTPGWRAVEEGNEAYSERRFEQALAAYDRAAALVADDPAILYNRGNTLHSLGRYEESSVVSLSAATAADGPIREWARYALGNSAYLRGDLDAAREAYVAVLRADPTDEDARHNLELVLLQQQDANDARSQQAPGDDQSQPGDQGQQAAPDAGQPGSPTGGGARPGQGDSRGTAEGSRAGTGRPAGPQTEADAQSALGQALAELGPDVTADEARAVLDRLRELNALERLEDRRPVGSLPDR